MLIVIDIINYNIFLDCTNSKKTIENFLFKSAQKWMFKKYRCLNLKIYQIPIKTVRYENISSVLHLTDLHH